MGALQQLDKKMDSKLFWLLPLVGFVSAFNIEVRPADASSRAICCLFTDPRALCAAQCSGQACSHQCEVTCGLFSFSCGSPTCAEVASEVCTPTATTTTAAPCGGLLGLGLLAEPCPDETTTTTTTTAPTTTAAPCGGLFGLGLFDPCPKTTTTTTTTPTTTTTTTITTTTSITEACLASGGQCMDMSSMTNIGACCSGLPCAPPGGTCQ